MSGGTGMGASFDPERIGRLRTGLANPETVTRGTGALKLLWQRAIAIILAFTALLYGIEGVDSVTGHHLDSAGIEPREADGLSGILFAPLLHANWDHLFANTVPFIVLGLLTLLSGIGRGLAATAIIWVIGGFGTWLTGPDNSVHIGASGLVFGFLTYLISRGVFARNPAQIAIGLVVGLLYGSILWGVLPGQDGISWQGHLFGAVGGLIAGWVLSGDARRHRRGANAGRFASSG